MSDAPNCRSGFQTSNGGGTTRHLLLYAFTHGIRDAHVGVARARTLASIPRVTPQPTQATAVPLWRSSIGECRGARGLVACTRKLCRTEDSRHQCKCKRTGKNGHVQVWGPRIMACNHRTAGATARRGHKHARARPRSRLGARHRLSLWVAISTHAPGGTWGETGRLRALYTKRDRRFGFPKRRSRILASTKARFRSYSASFGIGSANTRCFSAFSQPSTGSLSMPPFCFTILNSTRRFFSHATALWRGSSGQYSP